MRHVVLSMFLKCTGNELETPKKSLVPKPNSNTRKALTDPMVVTPKNAVASPELTASAWSPVALKISLESKQCTERSQSCRNGERGQGWQKMFHLVSSKADAVKGVLDCIHGVSSPKNVTGKPGSCFVEQHSMSVLLNIATNILGQFCIDGFH
jgi:hypothetical protein